LCPNYFNKVGWDDGMENTTIRAQCSLLFWMYLLKKKEVVNSSKIKFVSKRKNREREREGVVWQGASPTFDDFEQAGLQGDDFYSVMQPMPFHLKIKKKN
jgi:hypothetical protein